MKKKIQWDILIEKPCKVVLVFDLPQGESLNLRGYASGQPLIVFFDKQVDIVENGEWKFEATIPMKTTLSIDIERAGKVQGECDLSMKYIKAITPNPRYDFDQDKLSFLKFIYPICHYFPYLQNGEYKSKDGAYTLLLEDKVHDEDTGEMIPTPARVNRSTGKFFVSKEWLNECTVPMRLFILFHEFFHYYSQTTNEMLVDRQAAEMYVALNLPRYECFYALVKIFDGEIIERMNRKKSGYSSNYGTDEQEKRVQLMHQFLDKQQG